MKLNNNNLKKINKESKYMVAMVTAKRARELFDMEQKEKKAIKENEKNILLENVEPIKYLNEKERYLLKKHKYVVVALNELIDGDLEYCFEKRK